MHLEDLMRRQVLETGKNQKEIASSNPMTQMRDKNSSASKCLLAKLCKKTQNQLHYLG